MTDLKQLAKDAAKNKIFFNTMLPESDYILGSVFMCLNFLQKEDKENLINKNYAVAYEYLDKAGPMTINGYPIFFSCNFLTEKEYKQLVEMIKAIESAEKEVLNKFN